MGGQEESLRDARLAALRGRLLEWVAGSAYPLWLRNGVDPRTGGFVEALSSGGEPLALPRRVRVQPRQIYAMSQANVLGWHGDVRSVIRSGLEQLDRRYRRSDGLYRTLVAADGAVLDDRALLYDQAFVLLGFAAAAHALDRRDEMEARALELRTRIEKTWRVGDGGFGSGEGLTDRRESNPHMHLLEACLAWSETGSDSVWADWARDISGIGVAHFVNETGVLLEGLGDDWRPVPGPDGRRVEPGHMFEWGWLLLRSSTLVGEPARQAALRLIDIAEMAGVHGGVAVNALLDDRTILDGNARLWPQTERLKAALLAHQVTEDVRYTAMAVSAAAALTRFLETPIPGLWFDEVAPDGSFKAGPAPASTFYHLISALLALRHPLPCAA